MPRKQLSPKRKLGPRNDRAVLAAQKGIHHFAELHEKEFTNTLAAGQILGRIYMSRLSGEPCTCREELNILDRKGNLDESGLQEILVGGAEDNPNPSHRSREKVRSTSNQFGKIDFTENTPVVDIYQHDDDTSQHPNTSFIVDANNEDLSNFVDQDEDYEIEDPMFYTGYSVNACPICYGRGFSGGLDLHNGFRLVLAAADNPTITDGTINTTESPYTIEPITEDDSFYVDFNITVPMSNIPELYRLNNNTKVISRKSYIIYMFDGVAWTEIHDLKATVKGRPITLRIECNEPFTHFEATFFNNTNPVYIDFPQLTSSDIEKDLRGEDGQTIMYIGGNVPRLDKHSVIKDSKYKRLWYVQDVTPFKDPADRILYYEANVRHIQPQEVNHFLL